MKSVVSACSGEAVEQRLEREISFEFNEWQQVECWMVGGCMYAHLPLKILPDAVDWRCNEERKKLKTRDDF